MKECVRSILAQSEPDFDLLILDNNSSDGSTEWLQTILDPRIKLFTSRVSLTIEKNWGRVRSLPKGEFITLIGHDDILQQHYLAEMNALITKHPSAGLYQTHFSYIDAQGRKIRDCKPMLEKETGIAFLGSFLQNRIDVMGTGFMLRGESYDSLGGIPDYPNLLFADFELWISATMSGYKATSPRNCFSFRIHQSTTATSTDIKYHLAFERFVEFMEKLKAESEGFSETIGRNFPRFLLFYCQGLSHRLLRTPKEKREGLSVKKFVKKCCGYAQAIGISEQFHPYRKPFLMLAILIDSNIFTRVLFLLIKKLFPKPIFS